MTNAKTTVILGITALLALPQIASANPNVEINKNTKSYVTTSGSSLERSTAPSTAQFTTVVVESQQQEKVSPAQSHSTPNTKPLTDGVRVENNEGNVFINRTVPRNALTQVKSNFQVLETYEFSHDGKTYRNRVVAN